MLSAEITDMHVPPCPARKKRKFMSMEGLCCVWVPREGQRVTVVSQTPDVAVGNPKVPTGTAGNDLNN